MGACVCYLRHMRLHISLDDALVAELDGRVGRRQRSAFIAGAVARALEDDRRWAAIEGALGKLGDDGHPWDRDAAAWVAAQRHGDEQRVG